MAVELFGNAADRGIIKKFFKILEFLKHHNQNSFKIAGLLRD